jgi:hypothetical protein
MSPGFVRLTISVIESTMCFFVASPSSRSVVANERSSRAACQSMASLTQPPRSLPVPG